MLTRHEMFLLSRVLMVVMGSEITVLGVSSTMFVSILVLCVVIVRLKEALNKRYVEILLSKGDAG